MVGKEEEIKKKDFHQMTTKFIHHGQIHLAPLNGNPSVANKFNWHCWMANKMDSVLAIRWQPKPFWSPSNLVTTIRWKPRKEEYDKSLSTCFSPSQGWAT